MPSSKETGLFLLFWAIVVFLAGALSGVLLRSNWQLIVANITMILAIAVIGLSIAVVYLIFDR